MFIGEDEWLSEKLINLDGFKNKDKGKGETNKYPYSTKIGLFF